MRNPLTHRGVPEWIMLSDAVDRILGRSPSGRRRKDWSFDRAMAHATVLVSRMSTGDESAQIEVAGLMVARFGEKAVTERGLALAKRWKNPQERRSVA